MIEIIALALQTDSTRAITCVSGFANGDFGLNGGYHGFSHHGEREELVNALKKIESFQISMMSRLMDLLKEEDDLINGGSILDHTAILFGCGMATGTHSTKNLPLVLGAEALSMANIRCIPKKMPSVFLLPISCSAFFSLVGLRLISLVQVRVLFQDWSGSKVEFFALRVNPYFIRV